jgi:predicted  nucleic acid-binding Zn-ribbon protein
MWKTIADWLLAFFGMARELEEHRDRIRQLETRLRDHEEALKLVAQELRHTRELEAKEREKLMMNLKSDVARSKKLPPVKRKKR